MSEQRLPIVDGDDGEWGDILNQFLQKEHVDTGTDDPGNGGHKTITIQAGSASAGSAPIKFTSGTLMSTPEPGAVEFTANRLYFTQTAGPTRKVIAAFDDASGDTGDVYYRDSSGHFTRLAIGSTGDVLTVSGGLPSWGANSVVMATATKTTNYTVTTSDTVILADATAGNVTITLPSASSASGYRFFVKRIDGSANSVSIARAGSDTIDGSISLNITVQYVSITLISNGSNWFIV